MNNSEIIGNLLTKCVRLHRIFKDSHESKIFRKLNKSLLKVENSSKLVSNLTKILKDIKSELIFNRHNARAIIVNGDLGQIIYSLKLFWNTKLDGNWKNILYQEFYDILKLILQDFYQQLFQY